MISSVPVTAGPALVSHRDVDATGVVRGVRGNPWPPHGVADPMVIDPAPTDARSDGFVGADAIVAEVAG